MHVLSSGGAPQTLPMPPATLLPSAMLDTMLGSVSCVGTVFRGSSQHLLPGLADPSYAAHERYVFLLDAPADARLAVALPQRAQDAS